MWLHSKGNPEVGFTLLECIVAIILLGFLCAMAAKTIGGTSMKIFEARALLSDVRKARGDMEAVKVQFETLLAQNTGDGAATKALASSLSKAKTGGVTAKTVSITAGGEKVSCLLVTVAHDKASLSRLFCD